MQQRSVTATSLDYAADYHDPKWRPVLPERRTRAWFLPALVLAAAGSSVAAPLWLADQRILAMIIAGGSVIGATAMNRLAGLCLIFLFAALEGVILPVHGFTITKGIGIFLLLSYFASLGLSHSERIPRSRMLLAYFIWAMTYVLLIPVSEPHALAGTIFTQSFVLHFGLAFLIAGIAQSIGDLRAIAMAALMGCALVSLYAMGSGGGAFNQDRLWPGIDPNDLGHMFGVVLILNALCLFGTTRARKFVTLALAAVTGWGLVLTGSRGTMASIAAVVVFTPLFVPGLKVRWRVLGMICAVSVAVFAFLVIFTTFMGDSELVVIQRLKEIGGRGIQGESRVSLVWPLWWDYFTSSPIVGKGPGALFISISPHNDILHVLGSGGIFSFVPFVAFWVLLIVETCRIHPLRYRFVMAAVLVFVFFTGLTLQTTRLKSFALAVGFVGAFTSMGVQAKSHAALARLEHGLAEEAWPERE